jgi:hypothetical protein
MLPLAPAPVLGRPGATVSLKAYLLMSGGGAQLITLRRLMGVQNRRPIRPTESDSATFEPAIVSQTFRRIVSEISDGGRREAPEIGKMQSKNEKRKTVARLP